MCSRHCDPPAGGEAISNIVRDRFVKEALAMTNIILQKNNKT